MRTQSTSWPSIAYWATGPMLRRRWRRRRPPSPPTRTTPPPRRRRHRLRRRKWTTKRTARSRLNRHFACRSDGNCPTHRLYFVVLSLTVSFHLISLLLLLLLRRRWCCWWWWWWWCGGQVRLPRNQLFVTRVSARTQLRDLLCTICNEKNLDPTKYELRHPGNLHHIHYNHSIIYSISLPFIIWRYLLFRSMTSYLDVRCDTKQTIQFRNHELVDRNLNRSLGLLISIQNRIECIKKKLYI